MRPTIAYINLAAIRHNLHAIRRTVSTQVKIMAVVKANAYGHGAVPVSQAVLDAGADSLAVAILDEAVQLRQAGITAPILVLGLSLPEAASLYVEQNIIATVATWDEINALSHATRQLGVTAKVMVKIDTGMGRIGLFPAQAVDFIRAVTQLPEIAFQGIMTHLAAADATDKTSANCQLAIFEQIQRSLRAAKLPCPIATAANSATIIDLPAGHLTAVRPGIILYGLPPSDQMINHLDLQPAMELKTKIIYIKKVPKDTPIGYGETYKTDKAVYLATLPIGYADGYNRQLSNKAPILINGKRRQLVGRVCMDQIIVELGETCDASIGDEAVLFGRQGSEEITITELAELAGTINYELVCAISQRVPRIYLNE